ncbi:universal stress protein (plasmid) [Streptomyces sp. NBC_01340]|uniref:universal stress protein n=1 Tax=unclassified Streptomyces TaxID=2593676 RepID=UPI00225B8FB0|nr:MULTISPECIES: universal stress protein [unclassified Streptomyces]MCX4460601.1 universal stress protein [Streptomyces sp. NBC_01719]MCX4500069.1 universal stress protein [Streptomyces sp. NBC_01728]MCX4597811.1 universal stress protein [Streptomyces sp. NBC_01549]WSI45168.1 universal stress protein [Streptomyces sp. NBC_01340]
MSRPGDRRPIVVGVDPDPAHRMALAWAADEAARRRLPLRPVHVEGVPTRGYGRREIPPSWEEWNEALHQAGKQVLEEAAKFVTAKHPQLEVDALLAEGDPVWVLREQSRDATAVVLGSRHLSRAQEVFGSASVAVPVMAHAHCPVVVVPEPEHVTQERAYYVVGVDGSEHSGAAVDVAFQEAALRGAELRALYVWEPGHLRIFDEYESQQESRRLLSEVVAGRRPRYPEVDLRHELVVGHPVQVLTDASAHALGLVVGTRGRGGFTGMLLGSVSQGVLHHARCPVIAVPSAPA